jgi:demethylmenaquinone methyltransferase/2-methoxy-6-polyprenyl-1,4-benzoquinol methylase
MSNLTGTDRAKYVQTMFGRIAHRYDLLNRLMTLGQDVGWRKLAIEQLEISDGNIVLDIGAGTGDLAFEIIHKYPGAFVVASDFTAEMILVGKQRSGGDQVSWVIADAMHLPFANGCADAVVSGYLLRNVPDVDQTLEEQHRTLKPGGRAASLDTTPPRKNMLRPFIEFYLRRLIPMMGRLIAGEAEAYTYLPSSTEQFFTAEILAGRFKQAGFRRVTYVRKMLGTMAIHWGRKQDQIS